MGQAQHNLRKLRELANLDWKAGEVMLPADGPMFLAEAVKTAQGILRQERGPLTAAVQRFRDTPADMLSAANGMARLDLALDYLETAASVIREAKDRWRIASARLELMEIDR